MKSTCLLLVVLFLASCGAPVGFTATPTLRAVATSGPVPTETSTTAPSPTVLLSATSAPTVTPTSIPTATLASTTNPTLEPRPVIWDICPAADHTYTSQALALETIDMKDATNGWAVDVKGHILHSHDGGITWQNVTPPAGKYLPIGFFALDESNAWAAPDESCQCTSQTCPASLSHGIVWHTSDAGKTWQESQPFQLGLAGQSWGNQVPYFSPVSLQFIDNQTGWLLAAVNSQSGDRWMELYWTIDSGRTWHRVSDHTTGLSMPGIQGIAFLNAQTGWLAVNPVDIANIPALPLATANANRQEIATVLRTEDGGQTWAPQSLPVPQGMDKLFGYATQGEIKCGVSRVQAWPPTQVAVKAFCHANMDQMPLDYHDVFYSGDGGQTWQDWIDTYSVDAVSPSLIWHQSSIGSPSYALWWSDGGEKIWNYVREVTWQGDLNFVDAQHGWVVAMSGNEKALVYTADGGKNWKILHPVIGP